MLAEITKMTAQLFIPELGFIFLYLGNIKGLIDLRETFCLQSERALSGVCVCVDGSMRFVYGYMQ